MNSIGKECDELKHKYDDCFNDWFINGYLKEKPSSRRGKSNQAVVPCEAFLLTYQECTKKVTGYEIIMEYGWGFMNNPMKLNDFYNIFDNYAQYDLIMFILSLSSKFDCRKHGSN